MLAALLELPGWLSSMPGCWGMNTNGIYLKAGGMSRGWAVGTGMDEGQSASAAAEVPDKGLGIALSEDASVSTGNTEEIISRVMTRLFQRVALHRNVHSGLGASLPWPWPFDACS
jgi:hypothetical protein